MPQYKRVGHDFTMEFEDPNPEFWEPVEAEKPASTKAAPAVDPEESE